MTVAAWTHQGAFFVFKDDWEYNLVLASLFVLVATSGPGWSIDHALGIDDDLDGLVGLGISAAGLAAAAVPLLVFWRPTREPAP